MHHHWKGKYVQILFFKEEEHSNSDFAFYDMYVCCLRVVWVHVRNEMSLNETNEWHEQETHDIVC